MRYTIQIADKTLQVEALCVAYACRAARAKLAGDLRIKSLGRFVDEFTAEREERAVHGASVVGQTMGLPA